MEQINQPTTAASSTTAITKQESGQEEFTTLLDSTVSNDDSEPTLVRTKRACPESWNWAARLFTCGPLDFIPGIREINPSGFIVGNIARIEEAVSGSNTPAAPAEPNPAPEPEPVEPAPGGSAILPGADGAIPVKKFQIPHSQDILKHLKIFIDPNNAGGKELFTVTDNFFGNQVLDNVFTVGSGSVDKQTYDFLVKVKDTITQNYASSPSFKNIVDLRSESIKKGKTPIITIAAVNQGKYAAITRADRTDSQTLIASTSPVLSATYFNIDFFKQNNSVVKHYIFDNDTNQVKTVNPRIEHTITHELLHALTFGLDSDTSPSVLDQSFDMIQGKRKNINIQTPEAVDILSPQFQAEHGMHSREMETIYVPTLKKNIHMNMYGFLGEIDPLTNQILKEVNPDYDPKITYNANKLYNPAGADGGLYPVDESDVPTILQDFINLDKKDGSFDYPFQAFSSDNDKAQMQLRLDTMASHLEFPDGYFTRRTNNRDEL